jgi:tRNA (cytidine/uridine-2'-O-)-methyltransferase
MFNVVLVTPNIPQNTGAIGRICVNTNTRLHLIKPLSFDIDSKAVRRAGLDYWHLLDLKVWESLDDFLDYHDSESSRFFFATTKSDKPYFDVAFKEDDFLFFGSETEGLPMDLMQRNPSHMVTIPMGEKGRSLNQAVAVGIVLYDAIRQNFSKGVL